MDGSVVMMDFFTTELSFIFLFVMNVKICETTNYLSKTPQIRLLDFAPRKVGLYSE